MPERASGVGIIGVGKYIPKHVVTNADAARRLGVTPEWIAERTGITNRYVVGAGETASSMSVSAAQEALRCAGIVAGDVDLIICCTFSGDYVFPAMAARVQDLLGATRAGAFDVVANCTGFQIGVSIAADRLRSDATLQHVLVIGTAVQSPYIGWKDPESSMFFGDGAGAAVVSRVPDDYGVLASAVTCNGSVFDAVRLRGGGSSHPIRPENVHEGLQYYEMNGMETWKQLITHQPKAIQRALEKAGLTTDDVDCFILHQANLRLIQYLMAKMKLPMSKTYTNVERIGNTADASMAIALCEAVENGVIQRGHIVVLSGVGAGYIFGATVLRWY